MKIQKKVLIAMTFIGMLVSALNGVAEDGTSSGTTPTDTHPYTTVFSCDEWVLEAKTPPFDNSFTRQTMSYSFQGIHQKIDAGLTYLLTLEKDSDLGPLSEELLVIQSSGWYHGPHGGYALFTPKETGLYQTIISEKVWVEFIDIANNNQPVVATAYTGQPCSPESPVQKVVVFPLEAGKNYVFHITGSSKESIKVKIEKR